MYCEQQGRKHKSPGEFGMPHFHNVVKYYSHKRELVLTCLDGDCSGLNKTIPLPTQSPAAITQATAVASINHQVASGRSLQVSRGVQWRIRH